MDGNESVIRKWRGHLVGQQKATDERPVIARALDYLLRTHKDDDGNSVSVENVAAAIDRKGLSADYIYSLRSGRKRNPTVATLEALASYFGVPVGFFFSDPGSDAVSAAPAETKPGAATNAMKTADSATSGDQATPSRSSKADSKIDLSARIENLFTLRLRPGGESWTLRQVSAEAKERGVSLSTSFIHDLRRGVKDNPTKQQLECLADIFGVRVGYFFDDDDTLAEINDRLRALGALEDKRTLEIAMRSRGLNERDYRILNALIDTAIGHDYDTDTDSKLPKK